MAKEKVLNKAGIEILKDEVGKMISASLPTDSNFYSKPSDGIPKSDLAEDVQNLLENIDKLSSDIDALSNNLNNLSDTSAKLPTIQSGTITMPNTTSSPSYKGVTMTFPVAFESTPTLLISVKDPGWVNNNRSVSVAFDDLSKTGAHIRAWSSNQSAVMQSISCTVHWVAFGKI